MTNKLNKLKVILLILCAALMISASTATAATPSSATQTVAACDGGHHFFAKTKFALHMGAAVGLFYKWIYKPYKAGAFKSGASGRTKALIKAGITGLLVVHELHEACKSAQAAGGTLAKVVVPIAALETQLSKLSAALKSGHFNPSDIASVNTAVGAVSGG